MFVEPEEILFNSGPTWQGTAIAWNNSIDIHVHKLPVFNQRFCGICYQDVEQNIDILCYTVYLPTSGLDDEFGEVLSLLSVDIFNNCSQNTTLIIGTDSNQSKNSTLRRSSLMNQFLENFNSKSTQIADRPTFHHNNQISNSQIDHIFFSVPSDRNNKITLYSILCKEEHFLICLLMIY